MVKYYYLKNIRTLLTEGFTKEELRRLCYDADEFRPVYDQLIENTDKAEIIDKLIEHAYQKLHLETLLHLLKEYNRARYEIHQPYFGFKKAQKTRILLVDDNADWCEQLGGLLQEQGKNYEVLLATSRQEAIQRIKNDEPYNLAILDMRLDESDEENREGVSLGEWLRKNGYDLPIIIMSAYMMEADTIKKMTLRPFQFVAVEKGKIGSGGIDDLLYQIELALFS